MDQVMARPGNERPEPLVPPQPVQVAGPRYVVPGVIGPLPQVRNLPNEDGPLRLDPPLRSSTPIDPRLYQDPARRYVVRVGGSRPLTGATSMGFSNRPFIANRVSFDCNNFMKCKIGLI